MEILVSLVLALGGLLLGLVFGRINERRHYRSIEQREAQYRHILVFNEKRPPPELAGQPFSLVQGSVVVSSDYFKNIVAGLRALIGGNLKSYEALLERGRREALLRLKQQAHERGAHRVMAVQFETSTLNQGAASKIVSCEVLAYGTAFVLPSAQTPAT